MEGAVLGFTGVVAIAVGLAVVALALGALAGLGLALVKLGVWVYYGFIQRPEIQPTGEYRLGQGRDAAAPAPADIDRRADSP